MMNGVSNFENQIIFVGFVCFMAFWLLLPFSINGMLFFWDILTSKIYYIIFASFHNQHISYIYSCLSSSTLLDDSSIWFNNILLFFCQCQFCQQRVLYMTNTGMPLFRSCYSGSYFSVCFLLHCMFYMPFPISTYNACRHCAP